MTHFASTAKARAPHGAANAAPWMAIDADRVEREPIVARPLAPFVPAAPRPTLPGPREPALFVENSDLLGAAEAVRPLAELTNVDALAAWEAARRPSDIPSLTRIRSLDQGYSEVCSALELATGKPYESIRAHRRSASDR